MRFALAVIAAAILDLAVLLRVDQWVGIAALLEQSEAFRGQRVGTIICGSNLTVEQMTRWL